MNLQKLKEIKRLLEASKIAGLPDDYRRALLDSNCDKYGMRFGADSRFSAFKVEVGLDCYLGYHGNSSCATMMRIDNKIASEALNAYLNKNMEAVLAGMSEYMTNKAAKLKSEAQKEVDSLQELLESLDSIGG